WASFVAGIVYAYHGSMIVKISFPDLLAAVAWIPFVFLLVDRILQVPSWRRCAALATVVGLSLLAGHLQAIYFEILALIPFVLVRCISRMHREGGCVVVRATALLAVAGCLGVMVALVRLVPSQQFVSEGSRAPGSLGIEAASLMATSPEAYLRNLVSPKRGRNVAREAYVGVFPLLPTGALAIIAALNVFLGDHEGAALATLYGAIGILMLAAVVLSDAHTVRRSAAIVALAFLVLFDLGHALQHDGLLPSRFGSYFTRLDSVFEQIRRRQGIARTYIWATFEHGDPLYFLSDLAKAGVNHGIWMATDYEPLGGRRLEKYMDALGPATPIIPLGYRPFFLSDDNLQLVELMGVRFFLVGSGQEGRFVGSASRLMARWTLVLAEHGVSLYEDPAAMERCF